MAILGRPPIVPRDQHLPQQVPIDGYGEYGFRFAEMSHPGSLLCLPSGIHGWAATSAAEIDRAALAPIFEQAEELDLLIVGTGADIAGFSAELRGELRAAGVGVEVMATVPAIRTYNILLSEGRRVAAALIALS